MMRVRPSSQRKLSAPWVAGLAGFPLLGFAAALWWVTQSDLAPASEGNAGKLMGGDRRTQPGSAERRKRSAERPVQRANVVEALVIAEPLTLAPAIALARPAVPETPSPHEESVTIPVTLDDLEARWEEEVEASEDAAWTESVRSFVESVLTSDGGAAANVAVQCGKTVCKLDLMVNHLGLLSPLQQTMGENGRGGHTVRYRVIPGDGGVTVEAFMTPGDGPHPVATHGSTTK